MREKRRRNHSRCFAQGTDGSEFTGGNTWGHVEMDPVSLSAGEHEFESLVRCTLPVRRSNELRLSSRCRQGFEDCCDGHSELELHLPCDAAASPWRFAIVGDTDCLLCGVILGAECSQPVDEGR